MTNVTRKIFMGLALASTASFIAMDAYATEGYFTNGAGARNKAMAGAGVADGSDATALIVNPAGMVGNGTDMTISVSLFGPKRKFKGTGNTPSFTPGGEFESSENLFAIPNIAFVKAIDDTSSWGVSIAANGGMNTNYRNVTNPTCQYLFAQTPPRAPASSGVFCGGTTGINLSQALMSVGYAKQIGKFKIGVAPIFGFQMFEATGLQAFTFPGGPGQPAPTSNPAAMTNNGTDTATGFGGKVGVEFALSDTVRVGGTYQSKINMSKFDKYAGLFADQGDFDVPANYQVGISADFTPNFTLSADYKHISYSSVNSVGNPQMVIDPASGFPLQFGTSGGPGFGWADMDIIKVGAEWEANDSVTVRAGYAHNNQQINKNNITLNLLAPGVVQDHFTAGGAVAFNDRNSVEFGVMYAPTESVAGIEITPQGPNPGHANTISMKQFEVTVGWKLKFGH